MSNNMKNEVSAFAAVLADMRTNQTKQETAIGKMIQAVYGMEATFDASVVTKYFAQEAAKRKDMQNDILSQEDDTFAKELKYLDSEMDKDKRDRDVYEVENVKRRHNYLRGEFHKAMTALVFLRLGGNITGGENGNISSVIKLVSPKGKDAGRFFITWKDGDELIRSEASYSSRALINAGTRSLVTLKLKTVKASDAGLKGSSTAGTVKASGKSFETSVDLLLQKQTEQMQKTDPKAKANVHDLSDEAEQDVLDMATLVTRLLWTYEDKKVDMHAVELSLKSLGFETTYDVINRKKSA